MTPRSLIAQARFDSPLGPITVAASAQGLCGLWFDAQAYHPGPLHAPIDDQQPFIAQARDELERYWRGSRQPFLQCPPRAGRRESRPAQGGSSEATKPGRGITGSDVASGLEAFAAVREGRRNPQGNGPRDPGPRKRRRF